MMWRTGCHVSNTMLKCVVLALVLVLVHVVAAFRRAQGLDASSSPVVMQSIELKHEPSDGDRTTLKYK
jgi:hypothetical protein